MRHPPEPGTLALVIAKSLNSKIGKAATTYAAQSSCPSSCVFRDGGGCYAEAGAPALVTRPLNMAASAVAHTPEDVAQAEADLIDALEVPVGWPMRLHTVGDCSTNEAARIVSAACERYMERGGGPVWTYTHAWRQVERDSWGRVSVLASCETALDVWDARQLGYATALVVDEFPTHRRYEPGYDTGAFTEPGEPLGQDVLPCPSQTRGRSCSECRLCFDDKVLRQRGYSIGFAVHGNALTVKKALSSLEHPEDPSRRLTSRTAAEWFRDDQGRWPTKNELAELAGVSWGSASEMLRKVKEEVA